MGASRKTIREWVAGQLGRKHVVTQSGAVVGGVTITLPAIRDIFTDNERLEDAWLAADINADETLEWRRIEAANIDNGQVVINRAFDNAPSDGQQFVIYLTLNPDEWNEAINEALTPLYFKERLEVDLTAFVPDLTNENEFALSSDDVADSDDGTPIGATWLQYAGQVMGVRYRNLTTGKEYPVTGYRLREHRNAVTLTLSTAPWASSTYTLVVEALRYYPKLNEEDWGTTCPLPLWQAAVKVTAILKIINKYGERVKKQWAMPLAIAEKKLIDMRGQVLPSLIAREYHEEDGWSGPDIDDFFVNSGWV